MARLLCINDNWTNPLAGCPLPKFMIDYVENTSDEPRNCPCGCGAVFITLHEFGPNWLFNRSHFIELDGPDDTVDHDEKMKIRIKKDIDLWRKAAEEAGKKEKNVLYPPNHWRCK